jgi:hypothetical protein
VNSRLHNTDSVFSAPSRRRYTHLNNITIVPIRLATPVSAHAIDISKITLAVVRLNNTRVRMNFQKAGTVGTKPTRPYTMPPKSNGGTTRRGRISNRIYAQAVTSRDTNVERESIPWM